MATLTAAKNDIVHELGQIGSCREWPVGHFFSYELIYTAGIHRSPYTLMLGSCQSTLNSCSKRTPEWERAAEF